VDVFRHFASRHAWLEPIFFVNILDADQQKFLFTKSAVVTLITSTAE
jgi:hypothetical protein